MRPNRSLRLPGGLPALAALGLAAGATARRHPAQEYPVMPRPTRPHPAGYARPEGAAGPPLSECEAPRILIGNLAWPRERGGVFGADGRAPASFDGMPVETPGYFRTLRAEDAIGYSRGPNGILGLRDPMLLRGHLITRRYKEKRPYWVTPGLMTERLFTAGGIRRFPFVRLNMTPEAFLDHLRGHNARLTVELENPTKFAIPDVTVRFLSEPENTGFPMERRMALESGWTYERRFDAYLAPLQKRRFYVDLPGKLTPEIYREVAANVLSGRRWPYPGVTSTDPVRATLAAAGADLAALAPRRRLLVTAGDIDGCGASDHPVVVRLDREFRGFGTLLDGLDLEVLSAWDKRTDDKFTRRLAAAEHEFYDGLPPLLMAALYAKQKRIPVQRRPGGYDEFDAMAMYLYGSIANPDEGHTHFDDSDDAPEKPADHLYRHEGAPLPAPQRHELRERVKAIFARRRLRGLSAVAAKGGPRDYPGRDHELAQDLHDGIYQPERDWVGTKRLARENRHIVTERNRLRGRVGDLNRWADRQAGPQRAAPYCPPGTAGRARRAGAGASSARPRLRPPPARPRPSARPTPRPADPPPPPASPEPDPFAVESPGGASPSDGFKGFGDAGGGPDGFGAADGFGGAGDATDALPDPPAGGGGDFEDEFDGF